MPRKNCGAFLIYEEMKVFKVAMIRLIKIMKLAVILLSLFLFFGSWLSLFAMRHDYSKTKKFRQLVSRKQQTQLEKANLDLEEFLNTSYCGCIENFCESRIIRLVQAGANCNYVTDQGNNLLNKVLRTFECSYDFINFLLSKGANPNQRDATGKNALMVAIIVNQKVEIVQLLLKNIINLEQQDTGCNTALQYALEKCNRGENYLKIVELLINYGANLEKRVGGFNAYEYAYDKTRTPRGWMWNFPECLLNSNSKIKIC